MLPPEQLACDVSIYDYFGYQRYHFVLVTMVTTVIYATMVTFFTYVYQCFDRKVRPGKGHEGPEGE